MARYYFVELGCRSMVDEDRNLIRRMLRTASSSVREDVEWRRVEATGAEGFDYLSGLLSTKALNGLESVAALRLMGHISRISCVDRKPVLLDCAIDLLGDQDPVVRGGAAHAAILTFRALRTLGIASEQVDEREGILRIALQDALDRGLGPREMVERFLGGPSRVPSDELNGVGLGLEISPQWGAITFPVALCTLHFSSPSVGNEVQTFISGYECWLHYVEESLEKGDFEAEVHFIGQSEAHSGSAVSAIVAFRDPGRQQGRCKPGARFELREITSVVATGTVHAIAVNR